MENYNMASDAALDIIFDFFKERSKELKIPQYELAKIIGVDESTLIRYYKKESKMPLYIYLRLCGALKLRPYLIPTEMDKTEMERMFFN